MVRFLTVFLCLCSVSQAQVAVQQDLLGMDESLLTVKHGTMLELTGGTIARYGNAIFVDPEEADSIQLEPVGFIGTWTKARHIDIEAEDRNWEEVDVDPVSQTQDDDGVYERVV